MLPVTLHLPERLLAHAGGVAQTLKRPVEEVLTAMLQGVLPVLDDVPADMRGELIEMTWWDDATLLAAAEETLSAPELLRLAALSATSALSASERAELAAHRAEYGRITLRKARALALLSMRSGKRLLAGLG